MMFRRFVILLCLCLLSVQCDKPSPTPPDIPPEPEIPAEISLSASPVALSFEAAGGSKEIKITTTASWSVSLSLSGWCRPSVQTGTGNSTVVITATANEDTTARSLSFSITATGSGSASKSVSVTVNQEAKIPDPEPEVTIPRDSSQMRDIAALEMARLMGIGWNVGNSLDATGGETSWGNPAISKTLIDSVKAAGFTAVRIPVSWGVHLVNLATSKIDTLWLQRVEEVVRYVIDNDMVAIINMHHEGTWLNAPTYDKQAAINEKLAIMWRQIAIHFRDYDDRLLFAGTNEVHVEDDWSNNPSSENIEVQQSFNQTFVSTVRATGGRNFYRHLVVQAYVTNIQLAHQYMTLPTDSLPDRLMVEVHYYDPYEFTLKTDAPYDTQWGRVATGAVSSWGQEDYVDSTFDLMKTKFVDKGIPVILGEYGVTLRTSLTGQAYDQHVLCRDYYFDYVTGAALQRGLVPFYWDSGAVESRLFDRATGAQAAPASIAAILKHR